MPRGMEHLAQALTEDTCTNCASMSLSERTARLAKLEDGLTEEATPAPEAPSCGIKRRGQALEKNPEAKKQRKVVGLEPLNRKFDTLASEFGQIKALLLNRQTTGNLQVVHVASSEPPCEAASHYWDGCDDIASLPSAHNLTDAYAISIAASGTLLSRLSGRMLAVRARSAR